MASNLDNKLAAAKTRLILDKPFLGALVLRLPLVAADPKWCQSASSDAKHLYYNAQYFEALDIREAQFVLAKHALHCALSHFARRQHRIKQRWEMACDYSVNPLLIDDGLTPPPGTLVDVDYEGMTAEEIYPLLDDSDDEEENDKNNLSGSPPEQSDNQNPSENTGESDGNDSQDLAPQPRELSPQEQEQLSSQWQQRLTSAAQTAAQVGKIGDGLARMVAMRQPKLPWRSLLTQYMTATARDDYSYSRPSSRRGDPAIFPSLRSAQINIAVGVDISGSVKDTEMNAFLSEVDAIKGNLRARITLLPCDNALTKGSPWIFEPWEGVQIPDELHGGGGTSFVPVFDWVNTQDRAPDLLVYFTDAKGKFPELVPDYPVIWLVKGKQEVPWGQRVQLN